MAGNPVLPVSAESAKIYAEKRNKIKQSNTSEPVTQKNNEENTKEPKSAKKGFLTVNNILKVLGGLVAFGFAVDKVSNIPKINKELGKLNDKYKRLFTDEFTISRMHFNDLMDKLRENNNFNEIANSYELLINNQKGKKLIIGHKENKIKHILIHKILTFPIRFIKDVIMMPYKKIVKPLYNAVKEMALKIFKIKEGNISKGLNKYKSKFEDPKKITMLQNSIRFLEKIEKDAPEEFTKKVNKKLISSFDNLTKSSYENSDLNVTVKTAASAVTTGFLIADNYNMVMIDSQGNNKNLAGQKAKEMAEDPDILKADGSTILTRQSDLQNKHKIKVSGLSSQPELTKYLDANNFHNRTFGNFMKERFGFEFYDGCLNGQIKSGIEERKLSEIKAMDFLEEVGLVEEGKVSESELRKVLNIFQQSEESGGYGQIHRLDKANAEKSLGIQGKLSTRATQMSQGEELGKAKNTTLGQFFHNLGYYTFKDHPTDKTIQELMNKKMNVVLTELAEYFKGKMKGYTDTATLADFAKNMIKKSAKRMSSYSDNHKFYVNIAFNLITTMISCSALNWAYPRFIDAFRPDLAKKDVTQGGNK